jgi:predicted restriction endonuclease
VDANGNRCPNDRYLHIHHIQPVSHGGSNEPGNLTTLCSYHHDMAHQLSFGIEGQVTWLREQSTLYTA